MASPRAETPAKRLGRPKRKTKYPAWEYPEKSGIRIYQIPVVNKGKVYGQTFLVIVPSRLTGAEREKTPRQDKNEAFRYAEERFLALRKHGTSFSELPANAQREAAIAWSELKASGVNLLEAVRAGLRVLRPEGGDRTVAQVVEELTTAKTLRLANQQLRSSTPADFKAKTAPFVRAYGDRSIASLTRDDVLEYLKKLATEGKGGERLSPTSVFNHRKHLRQVLKYATERGYTPENPLKRLSREELDTYGGQQKTDKPIEILSIAEADALLKTAQAHPELGILASMVFRLFCGVRTEELCRLAWSDVLKIGKRTFIAVAGDKSKTGQMGEVDIPNNALRWLKKCAKKEGPIVPNTDSTKYCRLVRRLRSVAAEECGLPQLAPETDPRSWNSITRHTCGTMHFAAFGDESLTRRQLRHDSREVFFRHYRGKGISKEQGKAFFRLAPGKKLGAEIIAVQFAATA